MENGIILEFFDESFFFINYINMFMKANLKKILEMSIIIQTNNTKIRIVLIVESFNTSIVKYLKNNLIKTLRIDIFNQEMFEIWFDDNQTKLNLNIDSEIISSLLTLRNYLQHVSLNHQKMNKTTIRKLFKNLHHKSLKLLKKYEKTDSFPNQFDLITSLSTLFIENRVNSIIINQRQHQEQITTLYQQITDTAERIRKELCE